MKTNKVLVPLLAVAVALSAAEVHAGPPPAILVDLSFPPIQNAQVGDIIPLKLVGKAQEEPGQVVAAVEVILEWDSAYLKLLPDRTLSTDYNWLAQSFPPRNNGLDIDGLNDPPRWLDGNAYYVLFGQLLLPLPFIRTTGMHIVTFNFQALDVIEQTTVSLPDASPKPDGELATIVYDGTVANHSVTGLLIPSSVRIVGKFGDFDQDDAIEADDTLDMSACMLGPGIPTSVECAAVDFQRDADGDLADFARFMNAFSAE